MSERMTRQTFQQQATTKSSMYVDGGTNCCVMGRTFRMMEYTDRKADMTGFANDLQKHDMPIGSGLTKCRDKRTG